jgi:hypothetical protein
VDKYCAVCEQTGFFVMPQNSSPIHAAQFKGLSDLLCLLQVTELIHLIAVIPGFRATSINNQLA